MTDDGARQPAGGTAQYAAGQVFQAGIVGEGDETGGAYKGVGGVAGHAVGRETLVPMAGEDAVAGGSVPDCRYDGSKLRK